MRLAPWLLGSLSGLSIAVAGAACGDDAADTATTGAQSGAGAGSPSAQSTGAGAAGGSTPGEGSPGCGQAVTDPSAEWVEKSLDVDATTRTYFVYLPDAYDPEHPYPVVYQFHGCSSSPDRERNNPPVEEQSGADAIHIRGRAVGDCWENGGDSPDVAFFDALVSEVENSLCADETRRFATGYSSGAFMVHDLTCARGDMIRGVATIAGGSPGNDCTDRVAALLIHDDTDDLPIATTAATRDRYLENNGCDAAAPTTPTEHPPCEAYAGCDEGYPVVWCATTGMGHDRQDGLAAPAFWDFLSAL
jgi:poly(3-hydroxybutyrate) depolymerase